MLSAFFDIQVAKQGQRQHRPAFGKLGKSKPGTKPPPAKHEPRPSEACTLHARFVPLPHEKNAPKPAEVDTQQWGALSGSGVTREDDVAEFKPDWDEEPAGAWDEEEEMDEMSEPDFEPESMDPLAVAADADSVSSSLEDERSLQLFFRKARPRCQDHAPVYSGPQLCCEDDDFDD